MAGMLALGREYNLVPGASGVAIVMGGASGIGFVGVASTTATTSLAFTAAKTFGGSYVAMTPANGFGQPAFWYQQTAAGTAAWTKQASSWASNVLTTGATSGYVSYVVIFGSQMAYGYKYIKGTATNASLTAVLHDLTVQRTPANLAIVSA